MNIEKIRTKVFAELDSRDLANPSIRKNALEKVLTFIRTSKYFTNEEVILPEDKKKFKHEYETYKGSNLSSAESSVINEMYNQYES